MKTKIYLRIGKSQTGKIVVHAGPRPSHECLYSGSTYSKIAVPTLAFAVELEFPDELMKPAEQVAAKLNLEKKQADVCGKVLTAGKP